MMLASASSLFFACVADREDARIMSDEALFLDLSGPRAGEEGSDEDAKELGKDLREWTEKYPGGEAITLAECFRLALVHSEDLALQGERLFETWTFEREAIANLLPRLDFNWSYSVDSEAGQFAGRSVTPRDSTQSWFSVEQTLFDGRSFAAVPAARESRKIERLTLRDFRDRLLYAVAVQFYNVLGFERDLEVFKVFLESAEEFYRVLEVQWKIGEASRQNLLAARAQRDQAESQLIQGKRDLEVSRSELARLLGLDRLPERLIDDYVVSYLPGHIPDLQEQAVQERADVNAARAGIDFARAQRLAALSDYLPVLTAEFTRWLKRENFFDNDIDWNLTLDLTWSLFNSGAREARQARALSGIRQQELTLAALQRQVRLDVEEAVLSFESLGRMLEALRSRVEASRAALDLATAEYKANEATNLDVMLSRRAWEEAERDLARSELAYKLAALKIRLAVGDFNLSKPLLDAMEGINE